MKTLLIAAIAVGLFDGSMLLPAFADGPKASGGNTWPGMSERVEALTAAAPASAPHWVWQSTYDSDHQTVGRWVLVQ